MILFEMDHRIKQRTVINNFTGCKSKRLKVKR